MSKLKRRKTAVEEIRSEQLRSSDQKESLRIPDAALRSRTEGSPAGEGSSALGEVEKLWLETLQVLCPRPSSPDEALGVPPLPRPTAKVEPHSEQRWCSLDEDVPPLPDPLLPRSGSTPLSPLPQARTGRHRTPVTPSDGAGGRGCGPDANRAAAEGEGESEGRGEGLIVARSRMPDPPEKNSGGIRSEASDDATPGGGAGGGGEGRPGPAGARTLEHCPMCLTPFPAGFSQLECDGHLAQCLSETIVDVVW